MPNRQKSDDDGDVLNEGDVAAYLEDHPEDRKSVV